MPKDENGKRRRATENERVWCIELHAQGKSYHEIEWITGVSKSEAQSIVHHWVHDHTFKPSTPTKKRGRPPKLSARDKRHLVRTSDSHPRATLAEIVNETRLPIHPKTAGRYLRKENRYVRLALRKPWLNQVSRMRRQRWCRSRKSWKIEWRSKIYTDEMRLQVGAGVGERRKVWRLPGLEEATRLKNLQPTFIGKPFSVDFFAAFTYGRHTGLIPLRKRGEEERTSAHDKLGFNSQQYIHEC